ncbi:type VI secretion system baseplate subunit TssK [Massilia sp. CCM 8695]|uniref:Type VI secretion system baseplate subunit TssK n=1 Tax=Massilia frigida TaxID=2609281 RepID=A0ABX0NAB6_9BURK|nr:type VI secretion system baseplate subunit TssK [Massilia frigida]NHZ82089.1 type VI secretion system baseplate subunit TssK [Massilia frigida]
MSCNRKVVWSEGMLLQPQHLQQHDRYLQHQLDARVRALGPYGHGFSRLAIDVTQLASGRIALSSCAAVMPDGTVFSLPCDEDLPLPLDIPEDARDLLVVLAVPLRRPGVDEVTMDGAGADNYARHATAGQEVRDSTGLDSSALVQVGKLRLRLMLASDAASAHACLGVARVIERRPDKQLVLDPDYQPPSLDLRVAPYLRGFADELLGLLRQRGDALAQRLGQPGAAGAAEIADFLMLQVINRADPLFAHLAATPLLHPEAFYRAALQLAGELRSFGAGERRAARYPAYRHDDLHASFAPLIEDLRQALSLVLETQAVALALDERQYGIRVALLRDPELVKSATFVLAVNAQMPAETLRLMLPRQIKIGSVEGIRDLVNLQLPGIGLRPLAVAPRQLPFHAGFTYFELEHGSDSWQQLSSSAGFAMHVAGDFPGLQMAFWAIRS